jgi:hypothetical protein
MVPDDDLEAWVRDMIDAPPLSVKGRQRDAGEDRNVGAAAGDDLPGGVNTT